MSESSRHVGIELLKFVNDPRGSGNAPEKGRWSHRSPDLEVSEIIGEVKQTVPVFDFRHVFADKHGFADSFAHRHVSPSLLLHAEQQGIETESCIFVNPVTDGKPLIGALPWASRAGPPPIGRPELSGAAA